MIFPYIDNNYFLPFPFLPPNCEKPPTVYSILESIVNYGKDEKTKIKDLAKEGRTTIFDFEYPLSEKVNKEDFECMILNHFLMRRIGFETVTAFRIQLNVKLNEIMPMYNKLFDSLDGWNIFESGEVTERIGNDNRTIENITNSQNNTSNNLSNNSTTSSTNISDRRNSELPQNQLQNLRDGSYVSNYNYDTNNNNSSDNSSSQGTSETTANNTTNTEDKNNYTETIRRTPADKISIFKEFQSNIKSIYSMIFDELECLFYQIL